MKGFTGFGYTEVWRVIEDGAMHPYMKYRRRLGVFGQWKNWSGERSPKRHCRWQTIRMMSRSDTQDQMAER